MAFGFNFRKKGNKYGNKKVEYDGLVFDSKKEKERYVVLKDAETKGLISNLKTQVKYQLIPAIREEYIEQLKTKERVKERTIQKAITYTCDFQYIKDEQTIVEDVKASPKAASLDKVFMLKEKLFRYVYGFSIRRVYKPNELI